MEDLIMVFTRVEADGFDGFMSDPELVLAVVEDMGFNQGDLSETADPMALYLLMEGRWSGEERNFSFEKSWATLKEKFPNDETLKLIEAGSRNSNIYNESGAIKVLSVDQVKRVSEGVQPLALPLNDGSESSDEDFALNDLLPGLKRFFELASENEEFVLISWM